MGKCCKFSKQIIKGMDCFGTLITFRMEYLQLYFF